MTTDPIPTRRLLFRLSLLALAACSADNRSTAPVPPALPAVTATGPPPSVLVILLDDARCDMVDRQTMPRLYGWVVDSGLVFECGRGTANTSLCCPSRGGMFAGLDQHRTTVWDNSWTTGVQRFNASSTVFTALPSTIVTALIGKYLNNSGKLTPQPYLVPGVDEQRMAKHIVSTQFRMSYYNYTLQERRWQGGPVTEVAYGTGIQNYQSYVLAPRGAVHRFGVRAEC